MGRIGGHEGMDVIRENGAICKQATGKRGSKVYRDAVAALNNEARMLRAMSGSGWAPELIEVGEDYIRQTDVGDSEPITDCEVFRRNCTKMLYEIRRRGLRHGDLTSINLVVRQDRPIAIDWQESHLLAEPPPEKQPWSDSYLIARSVATMPDVKGIADNTRTARRWMAILQALGADKLVPMPLRGQTFLDLGTWQGDFVALAACEGMFAEGVDRGTFRSGEDSILIGRAVWNGLVMALTHRNLIELDDAYLRRDVVVCFSTYPYLVADYGREAADAFLRRVIANAGVFFFEAQLHGDGPGLPYLQRDEDIADLLRSCGASTVEALATIPVTGRNAQRTVWKAQR